MSCPDGVRANRLTSCDTSEAQTQGFELSHPNICPFSELMQYVWQLTLQIQSCKAAMTHGINRISERCPSDDPVMIG